MQELFFEEFPKLRGTIINDKTINNIRLKLAGIQCSLLIACILRERVDLVEYCIEIGANINKVDVSGNTPLVTAIMNDNIDIIRVLCENGADPNGYGSLDGTPLGSSLFRNDSLDIIKLLMSYGGDLNYDNGNVDSCILHYYLDIVDGSDESIEILIYLFENGLNIRDSQYSWTGFFLRIDDDQFNILPYIKIILEYCADPNIYFTTEDGELLSPLSLTIDDSVGLLLLICGAIPTNEDIEHFEKYDMIRSLQYLSK